MLSTTYRGGCQLKKWGLPIISFRPPRRRPLMTGCRLELLLRWSLGPNRLETKLLDAPVETFKIFKIMSSARPKSPLRLKLRLFWIFLFRSPNHFDHLFSRNMVGPHTLPSNLEFLGDSLLRKDSTWIWKSRTTQNNKQSYPWIFLTLRLQKSTQLRLKLLLIVKFKLSKTLQDARTKTQKLMTKLSY